MGNFKKYDYFNFLIFLLFHRSVSWAWDASSVRPLSPYKYFKRFPWSHFNFRNVVSSLLSCSAIRHLWYRPRAGKRVHGKYGLHSLTLNVLWTARICNEWNICGTDLQDKCSDLSIRLVDPRANARYHSIIYYRALNYICVCIQIRQIVVWKAELNFTASSSVTTKMTMCSSAENWVYFPLLSSQKVYVKEQTSNWHANHCSTQNVGRN